MLLRSRLLTQAGFRHAFTTRVGGVSKAPFDSLNLGRDLGDVQAGVAANHQRLAEWVGYRRLFEVRQIHSTTVLDVHEADDPAVFRRHEADALVFVGPVPLNSDIALGVRTADCVPLLIAHPPSGAVAAVHAGWRGVESGILLAAVAKLACPPAELVVAIGPHIRQPSFELGEDVAARLVVVAERYGAQEVVDRRQSKPRVDLTAIVLAQLREAGVTTIDDVGGCTYVEQERFFSYRRDGDPTGRHLAVIMARSSSS